MAARTENTAPARLLPLPRLRSRRTGWLGVAVAISLAVHLALATGLTRLPAAAASPKLASVEALAIPFEVEPPEPTPEPPAAAPAEPEPTPPLPEPTLAPPLPAQAAALPEAAPEEASAPEPGQPEAIELDGLTLTNDSGEGAGWSARRGSGRTRRGPLRAPRRGYKKTQAPSRVKARPRYTQPRSVAFSDLSSRPRPPSLNGTLRRYYPAEAKRRGIGGSAKVRVRVAKSGIARGVTVLSETHPGFGQACLSTVGGSRWGAPRDQQGRPVATFVVYRCNFRVDS